MALSDLLLFFGPILGLTGMALAKLPALVDAIQGTPGLSDFGRYMANARRAG